MDWRIARPAPGVPSRTRGGSVMTSCPRFALGLIVCFGAWTSPVFADAFDGMVLTATRGTSATVILGWTGGQPTFRVYRSTSPQAVLDPSNLIGTTDARNFGDTPPNGAVFYYEIKSPC